MAEWLGRALRLDVGPPGVLPDVAAVVDACLATRRRRYSHTRQLSWAPAAPTTAGPYRLRVVRPA